MAKIVWKDFLGEAKKRKEEELSRECNQTITGRFVAKVRDVDYKFSNDMEAQANFEKCARAFDNGFITEIVWTAYTLDGDVTRIPLEKEDFNVIYFEHLNHINTNISKFRDFLQPLIDEAKTVEEVEKITWN